MRLALPPVLFALAGCSGDPAPDRPHAEAPDALARAVAAHTAAEGSRVNPGEFDFGQTDLDGDGRPDAVVLLRHPGWTGSGGRTLLVFLGTPDGYAFLSRSTVTLPPVRVAQSPDASGRRPLLVRVRDEQDTARLLAFTDGVYPLNPTLCPVAAPELARTAATLIAESPEF